MTAYAYQQVVSDIRRKVTDGTLGIGERLPSTTELCRQYGVSKITIKRAMDELTRDGLISRRRGSGTFVNRTAPTRNEGTMLWGSSDQIDGFTRECADHGVAAGVWLREFSQVIPPAGVREELSLLAGEPCVRVARTLLVDDTPFLDEVAYLSADIAQGLREEHARTSIFGYLERELGLRIASSHRRIIATHPSADEAARLGIGATDPILKVFQTSYLDDGRPLERSELLYTPGYEFRSISTTS